MTGPPGKPSLLQARALVGDLRQLASVRRIVLDDGPERGVAALAFSTGGGLDFWALVDRAMDIGPLWHRGTPVAWQSPAGFRHPALVDVEGDGGHGFGRGFSGFLMTCGLDHTRWPADGQPQHGRSAFLPARLTSCGEDWSAPEPHLYCEGEITQWRHGAEALRLVRRIEAPIGGTTLHIRDRVENIGREPQRHALLYHVNFGYPAIAPGTSVEFQGETVMGPLAAPDDKASPQARSHQVHTLPAQCLLASGTRTIALAFSGQTLPHLQVWHDPRPHAFVLALEPCTSARPPDGAIAAEPLLAPGEQRNYEVVLTFAGQP